MKIRNGFVSNSSSSSFIVIASLSNHKRVLEKLDEYEQRVVNAIMEKRSKKFLGREIIIGEESNSDGWYTIGDISIEPKFKDGANEEDYRSEAWTKYVELLREKSGEVFTFSIDI